MNKVLEYERPILAESAIDLPLASARRYRPVVERPIIGRSKLERYMTNEEVHAMSHYLNKWHMPNSTSFIATDEPAGKIAEYFEVFGGPYKGNAEEFPDFVLGFFSAVYGMQEDALTLKIERN